MPAAPVDLKKMLSRAVLSLHGVAGVGAPQQGLTVYLADGSPETQARVAGAVKALNLPVTVHFEITGPIRAKVPRSP